MARFRSESPSSARSERRRRAPGGAPEDEWAWLLRFFEPPSLCAGPFGPPPERTVQNQQNGASNKALLLRPFRVARAGRLPTGGPQLVSLVRPPLAPSAKVDPVRVTPTPCPRERHPRLFREAPQLKTVATVVRVAGSEALRIEVQEPPDDTADRRRPAIAVATDAARYARRVTAEARGGPPTRENRPPLRAPECRSAAPQASKPASNQRYTPAYPPR